MFQLRRLYKKLKNIIDKRGWQQYNYLCIVNANKIVAVVAELAYAQD